MTMQMVTMLNYYIMDKVKALRKNNVKVKAQY